MDFNTFRMLFLLGMTINDSLFTTIQNNMTIYLDVLNMIDRHIEYIENPKTKRILNYHNNQYVDSLAIRINTKLHTLIKKVLNTDGNILIVFNVDEILIKRYKSKNVDNNQSAMMMDSITIFWYSFITLAKKWSSKSQ